MPGEATIRRGIAAAITALLLFRTGAAEAGLISNGSFESVTGSLTGQGYLPDSWVQTNFFSPNADTYSNDGSYGLPPSGFGNFPGVTALDGIRWVAGSAFGHLGSGLTVGGEAFGTFLTATLTPGEAYRIDARLYQSSRPDLANPGAYQLFLAANSSLPDLAAAAYLGAFDPTTGGTWEARSLVFTAPADAGSRPFLVFAPYQASTGNTYPGLDAVSLGLAGSTAVPEPTSLALFGCGIFGLATYGRFRRWSGSQFVSSRGAAKRTARSNEVFLVG